MFVGNVRITPDALNALKAAGTFGLEYVKQHEQDYRELLEEEGRLRNARGNAEGRSNLVSIFDLPRTGQVLWVLTPPDRSYTILMLPDEY